MCARIRNVPGDGSTELVDICHWRVRHSFAEWPHERVIRGRVPTTSAAAGPNCGGASRGSVATAAVTAAIAITVAAAVL